MRYIIGKQWLFFSMAFSSPCIQRWNVQVCPSIYSTPTNWSKSIMVFSLSMPMVARWCLQSYPVSAESLPGKVFLILRKRCRKKKGPLFLSPSLVLGMTTRLAYPTKVMKQTSWGQSPYSKNGRTERCKDLTYDDTVKPRYELIWKLIS